MPDRPEFIYAAWILSGYARHENNCSRTIALMRGEGLSQGGPGAQCDCGFKEALSNFERSIKEVGGYP